MNTMNSTGGMNTSQMLSTLGKEAPNFFGLTSLGSNCLAEAKPRTLPFHYYEPDAFVESFRTFRNEELEQALLECGKSQPGHEFILRSELSQAIRRVRDGAELSPQEWQAYHTYFDADTAGVISLDEFNRSVAKLREWSQGVEQGTVETNPVHYRSGLRLREEKARHRRLMEDPQTYIRNPVTGSQNIGWATGVAPIAVATALDPLRMHRPQKQTDIRTEGRGAADYL